MRRIKVVEYEVDKDGAFVCMVGEWWPELDVKDKILQLIAGKFVCTQDEKDVARVNEMNEQLMLADLRIKEMEHNQASALRKLEELQRGADKVAEASEELSMLRLIVEWFVKATTFDVWRVVAAKALDHALLLEEEREP